MCDSIESKDIVTRNGVILLNLDHECDLFQATNVGLRDHTLVFVSARLSSADGSLHFKAFTMSDL